jgi:hypothetical protein
MKRAIAVVTRKAVLFTLHHNMFRLLPINGYDTKERAEINFNVLKRKKKNKEGL